MKSDKWQESCTWLRLHGDNCNASQYGIVDAEFVDISLRVELYPLGRTILEQRHSSSGCFNVHSDVGFVILSVVEKFLVWSECSESTSLSRVHPGINGDPEKRDHFSSFFICLKSPSGEKWGKGLFPFSSSEKKCIKGLSKIKQKKTELLCAFRKVAAWSRG